MPYFGEPIGRVKIQTSKNSQRLLELTSVTFVRDRMLRMHARVALWSTRPRASVESIVA